MPDPPPLGDHRPSRIDDNQSDPIVGAEATLFLEEADQIPISFDIATMLPAPIAASSSTSNYFNQDSAATPDPSNSNAANAANAANGLVTALEQMQQDQRSSLDSDRVFHSSQNPTSTAATPSAEVPSTGTSGTGTSTDGFTTVNPLGTLSAQNEADQDRTPLFSAHLLDLLISQGLAGLRRAENRELPNASASANAESISGASNSSGSQSNPVEATSASTLDPQGSVPLPANDNTVVGEEIGAIIITINYAFANENFPNPSRTGSLTISVPNTTSNRNPQTIHDFVSLATRIAYDELFPAAGKTGITEEKFESLEKVPMDQLSDRSCSICFEPYDGVEALAMDESISLKRRKLTPDQFNVTHSGFESREDVGDIRSETVERAAQATITSTGSSLSPSRSSSRRRSGPVYLCDQDKEFSHEAIKFPCGHLFGKSCLAHWLKVATTCPLCRFDIFTPEEPIQPQRPPHRNFFHFFPGERFRVFGRQHGDQQFNQESNSELVDHGEDGSRILVDAIPQRRTPEHTPVLDHSAFLNYFQNHFNNRSRSVRGPSDLFRSRLGLFSTPGSSFEVRARNAAQSSMDSDTAGLSSHEVSSNITPPGQRESNESAEGITNSEGAPSDNQPDQASETSHRARSLDFVRRTTQTILRRAIGQDSPAAPLMIPGSERRQPSSLETNQEGSNLDQGVPFEPRRLHIRNPSFAPVIQGITNILRTSPRTRTGENESTNAGRESGSGNGEGSLFAAGVASRRTANGVETTFTDGFVPTAGSGDSIIILSPDFLISRIHQHNALRPGEDQGNSQGDHANTGLLHSNDNTQ